MQHELGVYGNFFYTSSNTQNAMLKSDRNTPNLCCIMGNRDELKGVPPYSGGTHFGETDPSRVDFTEVDSTRVGWIKVNWVGTDQGEGRFHDIITQNEDFIP